jgi:predicted transcriptional regulator
MSSTVVCSGSRISIGEHGWLALIAENTDCARTTVREHIAELLEYGLVEYHDEERAIYRLSDQGRDNLNGELDVDEIKE